MERPLKRLYIGTRSGVGITRVTAETIIDGKVTDAYPLPLNKAPGAPYPHSPDGHEWGYGGSGPTQLALDILTDYFGDVPLPQVYHPFRDRFIEPIKKDSFVLTSDQIDEWFMEA